VFQLLDKCCGLLGSPEGPFEIHGHNYNMGPVSIAVSFTSYIWHFKYRQAWSRWRTGLNKVCVCVCVCVR